MAVRTYPAMLLFLLAGWCSQAALAATPGNADPAAKSPFLGGFLKETRVIYPLRVGAWEAQGEHLYETPELGASVRYQNSRSKDRWLDAYFYPAGVMADSMFEQAVTQTAEEISAHAAGNADGQAFEADAIAVVSIKRGQTNDPLASHRVKPRSFSLRFGLDAQRYHSAMAMTVHDMYFIKIRYSVKAEAMDRDAVREEAERFLADLVDAIHINSTGDCWRNVRTIELMEGMERPANLLAGVDWQQGGKIWVAADAVHLPAAVLATPTQAIAAQALARSIQDTFRGRCVAPEDINAEVPGNMREIRLEFGAPPGEGDSQLVPLRQSATGVS